MTTLANIKSNTQTVANGGEAPTMAVTLMPPGFEERPARPIVYIGGEEEGGNPFYTWNHDEDCKEYVPVNQFSARLLEIKTLVKNANNPKLRSVKLVCEFETKSGARVAMSCGAKTWAAIGIVAGMALLTPEQLGKEIGLKGRVGNNGVTFINVYADGGTPRNDDAVNALREARADDVQVEAIEGYLGEINARIQQAPAALKELPF